MRDTRRLGRLRQSASPRPLATRERGSSILSPVCQEGSGRESGSRGRKLQRPGLSLPDAGFLLQPLRSRSERRVFLVARPSAPASCWVDSFRLDDEDFFELAAVAEPFFRELPFSRSAGAPAAAFSPPSEAFSASSFCSASSASLRKSQRPL